MCAVGHILVFLMYLSNGIQAVSLARKLGSLSAIRINKLNARRPPIVGGSRPMPSETHSAVDLIEPVDPSLDPKGLELNPRILHKILGSNFNPEFMSVEQPLEMILSPNGTYSSPDRHHIPRDLRRLVRKVVSKDSDNSLLKVSKRIRNKVKRFLISYTHCSVLHKWKDIGVRFWPRWIKTGSCDSKQSCSIPAGMRCKPMASTKLTLLRYFCVSNWDTKEKDCSWIEAQIPVTSGCKCGC
ncbi:noggin-2-like [Lineus longissimus]|uniref:noggin-2-like n=1 Tax=Lineus longissimus TaxID=88925 RepID=UPI002B4FA9A0